MSIFTVNKENSNTTIQGMISQDGKDKKIMFSEPVFGSVCHIIREKNEINNLGSFVAAFLSRSKISKEYNDVFSSVTVNGTETTVRYKEESSEDKNMTLFVKDGTFFKSGQEVNVLNENGENIKIDLESLGLQKITVPKDFKYTKCKLTNLLLKYFIQDVDYNTHLSKAISKQKVEIINYLKEISLLYLAENEYVGDTYFNTSTKTFYFGENNRNEMADKKISKNHLKLYISKEMLKEFLNLDKK